MLEVMGKLYEHAYEGVDRDAALEIAEQSHKNQARVPGIGYFYGELSWSGAWDVVGLANPKEGDVFIDMGSGVGKMVLAPIADLDSAGSRNAEGSRSSPSCTRKRRWRERSFETPSGMRRSRCCPRQHSSSVTCSPPTSDADIVYCFATCFSPEVTGALAAKLEAEMKSGARLILVSKQIESDAFVPLGEHGGYVSVEQSHSKWDLDCYIYTRQ